MDVQGERLSVRSEFVLRSARVSHGRLMVRSELNLGTNNTHTSELAWVRSRMFLNALCEYFMECYGSVALVATVMHTLTVL